MIDQEYADSGEHNDDLIEQGHPAQVGGRHPNWPDEDLCPACGGDHDRISRDECPALQTCDECGHPGTSHTPDVWAPTCWSESRCSECPPPAPMQYRVRVVVEAQRGRGPAAGWEEVEDATPDMLSGLGEERAFRVAGYLAGDAATEAMRIEREMRIR